jgi:hypothetical protein
MAASGSFNEVPARDAVASLSHRRAANKCGATILNFRNGTFQWVDVQRFRLLQVVDDEAALLAAVIEHELFGDAHAGGDPGGNPERQNSDSKTHERNHGRVSRTAPGSNHVLRGPFGPAAADGPGRVGACAGQGCGVCSAP